MRDLSKHKERMQRKAANRLKQSVGFTPVTGKRARALQAAFTLRHRHSNFPLPSDIARQHRLYVATPASINRHTWQPHKHKREIARRLRQQARKA